MSLCLDDRLVCSLHLHTKQSSIQSDIYQMSYWYNWFFWWWARGCPKHVENRNKHTWKRTVRQVGYLQRLYRDAWSTEHKMCLYDCLSTHFKIKTTRKMLMSSFYQCNVIENHLQLVLFNFLQLVVETSWWIHKSVK